MPCWFFPIATAAGNAIVLKPDEKDPSAANWLAALWQEADLPNGLFNVLHSDKVALGALLHDPDVATVPFVGSAPIARFSALLTVEPVADALIKQIVERMATVRTGNVRRDSDMGAAGDTRPGKVASYVTAGVAAGAEMVVGGATRQ